MGIKFSCPNGHKLHVKSFLAGKRGVCPHCSEAVDIPWASQADVAVETPSVSSLPSPLRRAAAPPAREAKLDGETAEGPDPIAAAGGAAWYVRPPAGGQFGPAPGELMRRWIAEGRVSGQCQVWREGWPQWRPASRLFPQLTTAPAAPTPPAEAAIPAAKASPPRVASRRAAAGRRRSQQLALTAVVVLALASVLLFAALLYVLAAPR